VWSGQRVLDALYAVSNATYDSVVCGLGSVPPIVNNRVGGRRGLPDGSAIYGMVFSGYGSHTQSFASMRNASTCLDKNGEIVGMVDSQKGAMGWKRCTQDDAKFIQTGNEKIVIRDVDIRGLKLATNEVEALKTQNFEGSGGTFKAAAQVDVVGAVYQYEVNVDAEFGSHGQFTGNPISNAQLFVTKHLKNRKCFAQPVQQSKCRRNQPAPSSGPRAPRQCPRFKLGQEETELQVELNLIRQETLDWAAKGGSYEGSDDIICGGDNMFHINKGAMGLRFDAGESISVTNVKIDVVENLADPGSRMCRTPGQKNRAHPQDAQELYMGGDAVGISVSACHEVDFEKVSVGHVISKVGNSYGLHLLMETSNVRGKVSVGKLKTDFKLAAIAANLPESEFLSSRFMVRHHDMPPVATPMEMQRWACRAGARGSVMCMMGMCDDDDATMDMGTGSAAIDYEKRDAVKDAITCSVSTELTPAAYKPADYSFTRAEPARPSNCPALLSDDPAGEADAAAATTDGDDDSKGVTEGVFIVVVVVVMLVVIAAAVVALRCALSHPAQQARESRYEPHANAPKEVANAPAGSSEA